MYLTLGHMQSTLADAMIKQRHGLFIMQLCWGCMRGPVFIGAESRVGVSRSNFIGGFSVVSKK